MGSIVFATAALVAVVIILVFGVITLVYPRIFTPKPPADTGSEMDVVFCFDFTCLPNLVA